MPNERGHNLAKLLDGFSRTKHNFRKTAAAAAIEIDGRGRGGVGDDPAR